jgi:hypothetical protein
MILQAATSLIHWGVSQMDTDKHNSVSALRHDAVHYRRQQTLLDQVARGLQTPTTSQTRISSLSTSQSLQTQNKITKPTRTRRKSAVTPSHRPTCQLHSPQRNSGSGSDLNWPSSWGVERRPINPKDILPVPTRSEPTNRNKFREKSRKYYHLHRSQNWRFKENKKKVKGDGRYNQDSPAAKHVKAHVIHTKSHVLAETTFIKADLTQNGLIRCRLCELWWHENCSAFQNNIQFRCDLCK